MVDRTGAGGRRRGLAALAAVLVLGVSAPAWSQSSADELARKHFESGAAYLQESDYPSALRAFEKAFDLSRRADILINIATVHERAGDLPAAVSALERYLELEPNGKYLDTVKLRLANLQKRIQPPPQPEPEEAPSQPTSEPEPAPLPPPPSPPPPTADRQEPNRVPAYVLLGVGGLAAVGAVVTGLFAQREYDDAEASCAPDCRDEDLSSGRSLALGSTILTGVAVVGVGLGAVLWFTADSSQASHARPSRFDVAVGGAPGGARAHALWRF
jgi:tetratricopeptide (TPR) repeat protein